MEKRKSFGYLCFSVLLMGVLLVFMLHFFMRNPVYYQLGEYTAEEDTFRSMAFGEEGLSVLSGISQENGSSLGETAAPFMIEWEYDLTKAGKEQLTASHWKGLKEDIEACKPVEFTKLANAYETILGDIVYFPLPEGESKASSDYGYENSWGYERSYGGERRHEGTDIMDTRNNRGFFPVVSVSDGVVEHVGWLELGGWRIGIRAPHGAYFYYAHLSSYDHEFVPGEEIKAGELLGFMGDSGYGKREGTTGNFAVHLHFGIYFRTDNFEELSVNPYWILKYLEEKKVKYSY